ncbi:MAG: response regulator, partial [Candidatus Cloacimonetes bacterium]|nr:response regulator [Candidatus Cloacimonadota bacterium]
TTKGSVEENNTQSFRDTVRAFERQYLESVLMMHDGNLSQTAHYLQMDKSNLSKKISALGISLARN